MTPTTVTGTSKRKIVAAVAPGDAFYAEVLTAAHRLAAGGPYTVLSIHPKPLEWVTERHLTPESHTAEARGQAKRRIIDDAADLGLGEFAVVVPVAESPNFGHEIVTQARKLGATLIVVGTHGRKGLSALIVGSVAEYVVRNAHCDVYVVRNRVDPGP